MFFFSFLHLLLLNFLSSSLDSCLCLYIFKCWDLNPLPVVTLCKNQTHFLNFCWILFRLGCVALIYLFCKQLNDCHSYCCFWFLHQICSVFYFCVFFSVWLFIFGLIFCIPKWKWFERKICVEEKLTNVKIEWQIYLSKFK